ncbi:MAG: hypothetical protein IT585_10815 [candidate division Zixibacteria bacterium]|nr:hypothetical protein [candidate division Zixibacteria bacterium]
MARTRSVRIKLEGNQCVVTPAVITVAPRDRVKITNATDSMIFVRIAGIRKTHKIPGRFDNVVTVPDVRPGIYYYDAFCYDLQDFCTSPWGRIPMIGTPIIIVPRRE